MLMQLVRLAFWALVIYLVTRRFIVMARVANAGSRPGPGANAGQRPAAAQPAADSPYAILGVSNTSSSAEIRAAYQALVRKYHPDLVATMPVEFRDVAEKKTKEINAAYSQLKRWGVVS